MPDALNYVSWPKRAVLSDHASTLDCAINIVYKLWGPQEIRPREQALIRTFWISN